MERMNWATSLKNPGKQPFLPPKCPFPAIATPVYGDYGPFGLKEAPWVAEGQRQDQLDPSEEQFSWLDELVDEPVILVTGSAHRRSSSDSVAYKNPSRIHSNLDNLAPEECRLKTVVSTPLWGSHELDLFKDARRYFEEVNSSGIVKDTAGIPGLNMGTYSNSLHAAKGEGIHPFSSGATSKENAALTSNPGKKLEQEATPEDFNSGPSKKDVSQAKHTQSDLNRVKQQFAQRSRIRKLQYIADLEKAVKALQSEGLEVSAELEFVNQQNLILSLENKVLKQRLDNLLQEQLIKCFQRDMLQREIARLQALFQQQQQLLQPSSSSSSSSSHGRINSARDLNSQFATLSFNHKETGLHIS